MTKKYFCPKSVNKSDFWAKKILFLSLFSQNFQNKGLNQRNEKTLPFVFYIKIITTLLKNNILLLIVQRTQKVAARCICYFRKEGVDDFVLSGHFYTETSFSG